MNAGQTIRKIRKSRGWTLRQLAERVGIHYAYLSQIERDEVTPSGLLLNRLAAAFGLTQQQLMRESKGDLPPARRLPDQGIKLSRGDREVRDRLAQFFLEEVRKGKSFEESGWLAYSEIIELTGEMDAPRLIQKMLATGLIETKRESNRVRVRLNPHSAAKIKALEEARELEKYRAAFEQDRSLGTAIKPHLQKLGEILYGGHRDTFHMIFIPGLSEMMSVADIQLDAGLIETMGESISYQEYYTERPLLLPWVAAYTSIVLHDEVLAGSVSEQQMRDILQDVRGFYKAAEIGAVVSRLPVTEKGYADVAHSLYNTLGLEFLIREVDEWACEALALCWVAYMYLDDLGFSTQTLEGELSGLSAAVLDFALGLTAKARSGEALRPTLAHKLGELWDKVADDNQMVKLERLQDILQFPWGL